MFSLLPSLLHLNLTIHYITLHYLTLHYIKLHGSVTLPRLDYHFARISLHAASVRGQAGCCAAPAPGPVAVTAWGEGIQYYYNITTTDCNYYWHYDYDYYYYCYWCYQNFLVLKAVSGEGIEGLGFRWLGCRAPWACRISWVYNCTGTILEFGTPCEEYTAWASEMLITPNLRNCFQT